MRPVYTYKKLLTERLKLQVARRAARLVHGTKLVDVEYSDLTLKFKTKSGTDPAHVTWDQLVKINLSYDDLIELKTYADVRKALLAGGLKVHCNCLDSNTRILTREGFKSIKDVTSDDYVLSSDGNWHKVYGVKESEVKDNWLCVKVKGLRDPLVITSDHELLWSTYRDVCACGCSRNLRRPSNETLNARAYKLFDTRRFIPKHSNREVNDSFKRYQMHDFDKFKTGELLTSVKSIQNQQQFDSDYARMLGYYLAEGCIPEKGQTVKITLNQNEYETIATDIYQYFITLGVRVERRMKMYNDQKWLDVEVYSKQFREDCRHFCGEGSKTKKISTDVLMWDDLSKEAFVIGHLLGDGAVDDSFRWMSTSKDLIDMIQQILHSIGINASTFIANNARGQRSTVYTVSCALNKFYPIYTKYSHLFRDKDKVEKNNSIGQNDVDDYILKRVISVEKLSISQSGYDIYLEDDPHNYIANSLIVSNCPAYKYWGMQYKGTRLGYSLVPERRRPTKSNRMPGAIPYVCKHLFLVMQVFPFLIPTIATKLKKQLESIKKTKNEDIDEDDVYITV